MPPEEQKDLVVQKKDVQAAATQAVVAEIVEAVQQERVGQININILLQRVTEHQDDPKVVLAVTEKMLELAEKYEQGRLKAFKERADAIIDVKLRDPDEVEKRYNNRARRCLKYAVGGLSVTALGGALACVIMGGPVVLAGLFGCSGALGLAMLGPMATGESVSSTDIVRIVNAIRGAAPDSQDDEDSGRRSKRKKR